MEILPRNGVLLISIFTFSCSCTKQGEYLPTWESLDSRPLPAWYDQAKFGIFIHWGVFSVPSYASELFWYRWKSLHTKEYVEFMENNYPPGFTYADFAPMFTAEFYDPDEWADVLKASGARYVVLTSKHHEGFTMWPSPVSWNWNAMDVGPRRDLVGELARSIRNRTDLHFGLYHSMMEWYNPLWLQDLNNSFKTRNFVQEKTMPELYDLVTTYRPEIVWSDGDINAPETYWNSTRFLAWLYNESPVKDRVVVNDRWGDGCLCKHGGFYTCTDNFNPGKLVKHKWENCMKIDSKSWGYRREATLDDYEKIEDLIKSIVETISCGGNVLLNIGPTHDGRIIPIFEERLRQIGRWLDVNGQAIYNTKPWTHQNDTITANVWYTSLMSEAGGPIIYAITLKWPGNNTLTLGSPIPTPKTSVTLLGYPGNLTWKAHPGGGIVIIIPTIPHQAMPCMWAWVFKIEN